MLFHIFDSQEQRREFGGSAFIEIQFCKLPCNAEIKDVVAVRNINHWQNDSLYINDEGIFYSQYCNIFDCGTYNDLKKGVIDIYGINYYAPAQIHSIIDKVRETKPMDYETLLEWLINAKKYNGFYILGI